MKQMSLANSSVELKTKRTRKRELLDEMELVGAKGGRTPLAVPTMLRTTYMQQ